MPLDGEHAAGRTNPPLFRAMAAIYLIDPTKA